MYRSKQQHPGAMREVIKIYRQRDTDDGVGGVTREYYRSKNLRASTKVKSGKEDDDLGQITATQSVVFIARNEKYELRETDKILWNGEYFNIRTVIFYPQSLYVEIHVNKGVAL